MPNRISGRRAILGAAAAAAKVASHLRAKVASHLRAKAANLLAAHRADLGTRRLFGQERY